MTYSRQAHAVFLQKCDVKFQIDDLLENWIIDFLAEAVNRPVRPLWQPSGGADSCGQR
ncbi:Uncharacterised protein [Mycobacteroides abscessus subsp. abscessus]|nr:Uncharacterised protein [Mycobacteroides abscessus subsp. abscessus]